MESTHEGQENDALGMRTDLVSMMMPFFPDDQGLRRFEAEVDGYSITLTADDPDIPIATPTDRKILNLLASAVAHNIRAGLPANRHVAIDTRTIVETMAADSTIGGSEYQRVIERLRRLMATVIETEMPIGDGVSRRRRFRWIDGFEHDDKEMPGGRKILGLQITLSEDFYLWITKSLGFDMSRQTFQSLTSSRSSIWRIYEVCLAHLIKNKGLPVRIPIAELRQRVPISSELKVFKSRTLRAAFDAIEQHPEMSQHVRLSLQRRVSHDGFEAITFSQRARLESIYVRVRRGEAPLPEVNRMVANADHDSASNITPGGLPMYR